MHFAVIREQGPDWDPSRGMREQKGWPEHAEFMDELARLGFIVLGGALSRDPDRRHRALLIVKSDDERAVEERLATDPWPPELLATAAIHRWEIVLGVLPG